MKLIFGQPLKPRLNKAGHAAPPGSGPKGETCGTCAHYVSVRFNMRSYPKCGLMESTWNNSYGTDIRKKDEACRKWEPPIGAPVNMVKP